VRRAQAVAKALLTLKQRGATPDLIVAHPGWGESLFAKEIFPQVPLLGYFEYFFSATGGDVGFDPEFPDSLDNQCRLRVRNAMYLAALHAADQGLTPTQWQHSRFPAEYQPRINVLHEGVDTDALRPDPTVSFVLNGQRFQAGEPIITFVARGLEPYRGFHIFMRALPELLRRLPEARVLIVGGDEVSYGRKPAHSPSWREALLAELAAQGETLDPARVHFTGKLPRDAFTKVLQVSAAHIYLTYPFVLSWSMLEAMACGALIVGSRTAPVEEVVEHGRNGLLVDFFNPEELISTVTDALRRPADWAPLRQAARDTIVQRYDLNRHCLPATLKLLSSLAG
jgi:glycosyltransferase involved in cell wall biosynthesis